jgi:hypothetical protein
MSCNLSKIEGKNYQPTDKPFDDDTTLQELCKKQIIGEKYWCWGDLKTYTDGKTTAGSPCRVRWG